MAKGGWPQCDGCGHGLGLHATGCPTGERQDDKARLAQLRRELDVMLDDLRIHIDRERLLADQPSD